MSAFVLTPLISLLVTVAFLGWTIARGNKENAFAISRFLLSAMVIGICSDVLRFFSLGARLEQVVCKIGFLSWISMAFFLLWFSYRLVGRNKDRLFWCAAFVCGLSGGAALLAKTVLPLPAGAAFAVVLVAIGVIARAMKHQRNEGQRSSLRILLIGSSIWLGLVLVVFGVVPAVFDLTFYSRFGSSLGVVLGFCLIWAERENARTEPSIERVVDALFDAVHEGIVIADLAGEVQQINKQAREIFGVSKESLANLNVRKLLPGCDFSTDFSSAEIEIVNRSFQRKLSVSHSIWETGGMETAGVLIVRDVTERKKAEHVLESVRLRAVREKEQRDARMKRLERLEKKEALGTMAGGIAHDFNNLLSAILGFSTVVQDELDRDHPIQSDLKETNAAAMRTRDIVRQILVFSRKDDHSSALIDLRTVLEQAVELLRVSFPRSIDIRYSPPNRIFQAECSGSELLQVILSLGNNAQRAMEETRGGVLSILIEQTELTKENMIDNPHLQPGPYAKIAVVDTGIGIEEDNLPRIYDPFFTTWHKTTASGPGLGLSASHGIVHAHGGVIEVESEPGSGTQVNVFLPLAF